MDIRSMEKVPWNSIELWIWTKFHGIPWNLRFCCLSFMEFHGNTGGALQVPWNFMEFHGTAHVNEIGALQVPKFVLNLDRILWNLSVQILMKIIFNFVG